MRSVVASAVVALLACPAALAGTPEDPELVDPTGDTFLWPSAPAAGPIADMMDIRKVWLEEQVSHVLFHMEVVDLGAYDALHNVATGDMRWWVDFRIEGSRAVADDGPWRILWLASQGTIWGDWCGLLTPIGDQIGGVCTVDQNGGRITFAADKLDLGLPDGGRLYGFHARTGTYMPAYPVWIGDDGTGAPRGLFAVGPANQNGSTEPDASPPAAEGRAGAASDLSPGARSDEGDRDATERGVPGPGAALGALLLAGAGLASRCRATARRRGNVKSP